MTCKFSAKIKEITILIGEKGPENGFTIELRASDDGTESGIIVAKVTKYFKQFKQLNSELHREF